MAFGGNNPNSENGGAEQFQPYNEREKEDPDEVETAMKALAQQMVAASGGAGKVDTAEKPEEEAKP